MVDRTVAGRYRLTEKLGAGGMGVVWRAEDTRLRRIVAVKELLARNGFDEESTRRAVREARIAARLQHSNVIALYDVVEDEGHPWLVMEYLPAKSLSAVISERGTLPADEVRRIAVQLAEGLAAAHKAGVVHRDVKPGNVLVTEFGTVKVTDFGTSRAADEATVTSSGLLVGTPAYLAPEVAQGSPADFPADVFGLGATLYAALEGSPPFGEDTNAIALLHRAAAGTFPAPENAGALEPVLLRLLDADPGARPTMAEAARMLQEISVEPVTVLASPTPVEAEPTRVVPPAKATTELPEPEPESEPEPEPVVEEEDPQRKRFALVAVVLIMVVVGTVAFLITRSRGKDDKAADTTTTTTGQTVATSAPPTSDAGQPPPQGETPVTSTTSEAPPPTTVPPAAVTPDKALVDYYALLPGNIDAAFPTLTESFRNGRGVDYDYYRNFWAGYSAVSLSNVQVVGENQVSATVNYTDLSGAQKSENNLFTLVKSGDKWLIDNQVGI
ncbi:serine/threonine-protein kinase [Saccharothrix violaceirubra]|uniref:non-specific serine/threonine protein kinase n=1 Tax=Saccharothrix violaceirubra TaxID=413306 RepID=A0A7W7WW13_9PSEU|nr:serine/threonine-protein kinase [Saccharothrix violaceirubra]MBB4965073.1 serine/threonine protein kinase [Saccharothrix violaceirubra]